MNLGRGLFLQKSLNFNELLTYSITEFEPTSLLRKPSLSSLNSYFNTVFLTIFYSEHFKVLPGPQKFNLFEIGISTVFLSHISLLLETNNRENAEKYENSYSCFKIDQAAPLKTDLTSFSAKLSAYSAQFFLKNVVIRMANIKLY